MKMFTFYDAKAEVYSRPFFALNRGSAIRSVGDMLRRQDEAIAAHPEDYFLFEIGEFDDQSGEVVPCDRVALGCAVEFLRKDGE